jgi:hypothetical protein
MLKVPPCRRNLQSLAQGKNMNCKEYKEKYAAYEEQEKDFWSALTSWLELNPERFIFFRAYVPGFMDGEPCLPCLEIVGAGPGFIGDHYVDSAGDCHYAEDVSHENRFPDLPKSDHELAAVLENGYERFIGEWDVSGTIKLVQDRRRKDYGKPEIKTKDYECGY